MVHPEDVSSAQEAYYRAIKVKKGYSEPLEMRVLDASKDGHYLDVHPSPSTTFFSLTRL
jgi:hypothetical protein